MAGIFGSQSPPEPPPPPPVTADTPQAIATSDIVDARRAAAKRRIDRNDLIKDPPDLNAQGGTGLYLK